MGNIAANAIRRLQDANLTKSIALPAAGSTANSASIDLGSTNPGPLSDYIELLVSLPSTPSLADAKTVTCTVQDSADNASFAAITALGTLVVTGAGGAGAGAASLRLRLPPMARQYLRLSVAVQGSGGDNTAVSASLALLVNPS